MKRLLAISTLLILTACAAPITATPTPSATTALTSIPSNTPPPTVTPTSTATPTITPSPTGTATLTPPFGPSPTPSLTPTLTSWVERDFLFGGPAIEGCELPCWQGLVPGESSAEEVDQVFTQVFGYGREYDSIEEAVEIYQISGWPLLYWAGGTWDSNNQSDRYITGGFSFASAAWLDYEMYNLFSIQFIWKAADSLSDYTPAHLIWELGQPSIFLVSVFPPDRSTIPHWYTSVILVFSEPGLIYTAEVYVEEASDDGVSVCLDGKYWSGPYDGRRRSVTLTRFTGESFPTPEQEFLLQSWTTLNRHRPFQEVFGVSLEGVTQQIQSGGLPCWWYAKE